MFTAIFIVLLVCVILLDYLYKRRTKELGNRIPGPIRLPLIGNAHLLLGDGFAFRNMLSKLVHEYGKRLRVYIGPQLFIVLTDAKDVEVVLSSTAYIEKGGEYQFFHPWLATGLITSGGSKWKSRRKMITPAFHFKILESFLPIFENNSDILVKKLSKHVGNEKFDIYKPITLCTLDIISEAAMGVKINAQTDDSSNYASAIKVVLKIILMRMKSVLHRPDLFFYFTKYYSDFNDALKIIHDYTKKVIKGRRDMLDSGEINLHNCDDNLDIGTKKKLALLDLLITSDIDGVKLDDDSIREEVNTFLFAGHDTTTSAISFALHSIAANQHIQNKLFEEQITIFNDDFTRPITYNDLQNMKYLEATIKETLRLYPSVPLIARELTTDVEINDMKLPAGATIVVDLFELHRDPEVFHQPEKFIPERFIQQDDTKKNPYSCIFFSAGPRNCIGQKFAMLKMKMIISKIIKNYKLIPVDDELKLSANIILTSLSGIYVEIAKR